MMKGAVNGPWYPGERGIFCLAQFPPEEVSIKSTPAFCAPK